LATAGKQKKLRASDPGDEHGQDQPHDKPDEVMCASGSKACAKRTLGSMMPGVFSHIHYSAHVESFHGCQTIASGRGSLVVPGVQGQYGCCWNMEFKFETEINFGRNS
jgi:hypothetical protein